MELSWTLYSRSFILDLIKWLDFLLKKSLSEFKKKKKKIE